MSHESLTLFLDIGVLNSAPLPSQVPEDEFPLSALEHLRALEVLCDEADINTIVVSSPWCTGHSSDELRFLFAKAGFSMPGRINGSMNEATDTPEDRTEAIQIYVDEYEIQRFLVLDTLPLSEMRDGIVIQCDANRGLTIADLPGIVRQCQTLPVLSFVTRTEHAVVDALVALLARDEDPEGCLLNALLNALEWHLRHEWPRPDASFDGMTEPASVERSDRGLVVIGGAWELGGSNSDKTVRFTLRVEADAANRRLKCFEIQLAPEDDN